MTVPPGYHDLPRYLQSLSLCTSIWFPEGKWALPTWYYCINFPWGDETKCVKPRYGIKHKSSLSTNLENWRVYSPGERLVPGEKWSPETVASPQSSTPSQHHGVSLSLLMHCSVFQGHLNIWKGGKESCCCPSWLSCDPFLLFLPGFVCRLLTLQHT